MRDTESSKQDGVNLGYRDQLDQGPASLVDKANDGPFTQELTWGYSMALLLGGEK